MNKLMTCTLFLSKDDNKEKENLMIENFSTLIALRIESKEDFSVASHHNIEKESTIIAAAIAITDVVVAVTPVVATAAATQAALCSYSC